MKLVEHIFGRGRRWWLILVRRRLQAKYATEAFVKAGCKFPRESEPGRNDNLRHLRVVSLHGVVDRPQRDVDDVLKHTRCHNPINEQWRGIERINDNRALRGDRQFFFS